MSSWTAKICLRMRPSQKVGSAYPMVAAIVMILSDQLYCRMAPRIPIGIAMTTVKKSETPISWSVLGIRPKILSRTGRPSVME
jgi:hypothetical protein